MPGRFIPFLLALGGALGAGDVAAADKQARRQPEVQQLLQAGWTRSLRAAAEAETLYEQIKRQAPADARVPYAHSLVQIKQGRFARAQQLANDALALAPDYTPAWQAKLWLQVLTKKYGEALAQTDRIAAILARDHADPRNEAAMLDALTRLGALVGFMEGPVGGSVDQTVLARQKERIIAPLSEPRKEAFQAGHRRVTEQLRQLLSDLDDAQNQAKDSAQQKQQQLGEDIQQQQQDVNRQLATFQEEQTNARQDVLSELKEVQETEAPLLASLVGLQRQAQTARREVLWLERELQRLYGMLQREEDTARQRQLRYSINRVDIRQRRYARDLRLVGQEVVATQTRVQGLHRRRAGAQRQYEGQLRQIENQRQASLRQQKRIDGQQKRLLRPKRETSAQVRGIATRAKSLTTYAPFPLDIAKQELLDSLR